MVALSPSDRSSTFEANKIFPPFVVKVASAVLEMLVLARMVMPAPEAVERKLLFKLICPPSTVIGPVMLIAEDKVMSALLVLLPKVKPVSVVAQV